MEFNMFSDVQDKWGQELVATEYILTREWQGRKRRKIAMVKTRNSYK